MNATNFDAFRADKDGIFHFEGVSNKQHPIQIPWLEPDHGRYLHAIGLFFYGKNNV